jgi:hypothetical protein
MLLVSAPQQTATAQEPADPVVDLGDIVVDGRRIEDLTQAFVREVAAPARNRGLARWRDGVCIGVVNLKPDTAQYIIDRVSTVAADLGLSPGLPDCTLNVMVIATVNSTEFKEHMDRQGLELDWTDGPATAKELQESVKLYTQYKDLVDAAKNR